MISIPLAFEYRLSVIPLQDLQECGIYIWVSILYDIGTPLNDIT